jgi:hypothetical protein
MRSGEALAPGGHNMLLYGTARGLREIYCSYAEAFLPADEMLLIGTQYETVEKVKENLKLAGVDVAAHLSDGTLFVVDAQKGYSEPDAKGTFKLALTLVARAKKEGRRGLTWIGDMGSFFGLGRVEEMMAYELSRPTTFDDALMKTVCCYHKDDFGRLGPGDGQTLLSHHVKTFFVED